MDADQYRDKVLAYARKRGFSEPQHTLNDWTFRLGGNSSVTVRYDPAPLDVQWYWELAKRDLAQQSRYSLQHPKRANPSVNVIDDWLFAECAEQLAAFDADYENDDQVGKWLIFSLPDAVDDHWRRIKAGVEDGRLSISAKVATYLNWISSKDGAPKHHVICVYTADWRDRADVFKHRETLRDLGFGAALYYKSNEMTRLGRSGSIYRG